MLYSSVVRDTNIVTHENALQQNSEQTKKEIDSADNPYPPKPPTQTNANTQNLDIFNATEAQPYKITYSMFLFNKRSFFAYVSCALIGVYTSFNYAFLSLVLQEFGLSDSQIGYVFAIPCLAYCICTVLVSYVVGKLPRRLFIFISFMLFTVSLFLLGPSLMLHMPDLLWILILGYAINGCA